MDDLKMLHEKLKPLIVEAGVEEKRYDHLFDSLTEEKKQDAYDAYIALKQGAWKNAELIKRLLPDHVWKMFQKYAELGMTDSRELVELRSALKHLRTNYHKLFKELRHAKGKQKGNPKVSQQLCG